MPRTFAPVMFFALCLLAASGAVSAQAGLVAYEVRDFGIPTPLTTTPGDAARGRAAAIDREAGNCLACHAMPVDEEFHGTTGPSLVGVGARRSAAELRLRIVNPKLVNPATIMPAYYRVDGLHRVHPAYAGRPILSAQQVEDVVAFLASLR